MRYNRTRQYGLGRSRAARRIQVDERAGDAGHPCLRGTKDDAGGWLRHRQVEGDERRMPTEHGRLEGPWTKVGALAGVVAAFIALVALFAASSGSGTDTNDGATTSPPPGTAAPNTPAPPDGSGTDVGPTAETRASERGTVRHQGILTIATGGTQFHDLDSPASDPQWQTGGSDITYSSTRGEHTIFRTGGTFVLLGDEAADYDKCRNTTGYSRASRISDLDPGAYLCWKTNGGRYVALRVIELSAESITLDVASYDPPDE
jgi:hypothetical protein